MATCDQSEGTVQACQAYTPCLSVAKELTSITCACFVHEGDATAVAAGAAVSAAAMEGPEEQRSCS